MIEAVPIVRNFLTFENLKGDENYKRLHIKIQTQNSLNQYINKVVCVLFFGDHNVQKNPPLTLMTLPKTIQSSYHISFKHWLFHYPPKSPTWFLPNRFSKQT